MQQLHAVCSADEEEEEEEEKEEEEEAKRPYTCPPPGADAPQARWLPAAGASREASEAASLLDKALINCLGWLLHCLALDLP